ncbi:MAG: hypothetical protein KIC90_05780 [Firmicutes bacterium]|nr:hypothetical protein [Bacillota bacterium]
MVKFKFKYIFKWNIFNKFRNISRQNSNNDQYEVGSSASTTTVDKKIGLMYISDYGFAADQSGWTTKLSSYSSNNSKNWLFLGSSEWTISRRSDNTTNAFLVSGDGRMDYLDVGNLNGARPVFNLLSSVTYASGSGTSSDPIRIN